MIGEHVAGSRHTALEVTGCLGKAEERTGFILTLLDVARVEQEGLSIIHVPLLLLLFHHDVIREVC